MKLLGMKIAYLMLENNISEVQLARYAGVTGLCLKSLLKGKRVKKGKEAIKKIANFFDVSVEYLLEENTLENIYIPEGERHHSSPGGVLRYLMRDIGNISEGELSRRTGVPQPTIHRIVSGMTPAPRMDAVKPLAEFFNVSPDQLLGRVPLPKERIPGTFAATQTTKKIVPLIEWDEVFCWPKIVKFPGFKARSIWVTSDLGTNGEAFALKIFTKDYFPDFREGSIIIVDCKRPPKSGDFVIGFLKKAKTALLGKLILRENHKIFLSLSKEEHEFIIGIDIFLCGVVSEARHSF